MIHNYVINTEYICIIELPLDIDRTLSLSLVTSVGWTKQQVEDFNYFSQYQWSNVISNKAGKAYSCERKVWIDI